MNFNDLLKARGVDPRLVLAFRHRPNEPELNKILPWLAAERPEVFNAYQQTQGDKVERAMERLSGSGHIASFIRHGPGQALFIGLYSIGHTKPLTRDEYWEVPAYAEMKTFGMTGFTGRDGRESVLWFDLVPTDFYAAWKGRLIVEWPPPERSWWRRAHRNDMQVLAVLESSALDAAMPEWHEMTLSWDQIRLLPSRWEASLSQWRGVYYIFDTSDGKGYVGSAYGKANLCGRWLNYAARGHGGNKLLRERDPRNFRFSILQRVSPDTEETDVIRLEGSWKERLHTRQPFGLNDN